MSSEPRSDVTPDPVQRIAEELPGYRAAPFETLVLRDVAECPCCGLYQKLGRIDDNRIASCSRCGQTLVRRNRSGPVSLPLAFCITSAALYLGVLFTSLMTLNLYGRERTVVLITGPLELFHEGWGPLSVLVGLATVFAPGAVIALMALILLTARRPSLPRWAPALLKWYERLRPWSMMEVYILGVLVAYTKLVDLAYVDVGPATYMIGALMISMAATDQTLDSNLFWRHRRIMKTVTLPDGQSVPVRQITPEDGALPPATHMASCSFCGLVGVFPKPVSLTGVVAKCPRCGHQVRRRKPDSLNRTTALLLAALIFYVPANLMPVMTVIKLGHGSGHTIMNGVVELWQADMIPLALLVLFASITVPVAKILGLSWMLIGIHWHSDRALVFRTRFYRVIELIGRWSMIDVFMISILVAMVRFSNLASISANGGVVSFAAVVIITIFAASAFDPRLMWDVAGKNGQVFSSSGKKSHPDAENQDAAEISREPARA
ncbi:paraquat-inducible protein A [Acetobacter sp. AN02]|uniref:paraquat-inducible protein A n=1 Tax=Acetobacter sp. AN02 TaxID=2894186 RepID=UPI002434292A|nr:paraquat-inducible protein A [Acetobacter sp. AN02]MDG6094298.1 paraquat-inducible protein A [Acetobacter sp. AN02]